MSIARRLSWLLAVGVLVAAGCGKSKPDNAPATDSPAATGEATGSSEAGGTKSGTPAASSVSEAAPADTADAAVRNVAEGFVNNRPQAVWEALPASYQQDANHLVHDFAAKMDAEVWNRTFLVLRKLANVLEGKRELVVNAPEFTQAAGDPETAKRGYDNIVALLKLTVNSELSDLEKLKSFDGQQFLAGTGSQMFERIRQLAAMAPEDPFAKLAQVKATLVRSEGDTALVRIEAPGEEPEEEEFVRVEGKWIPKTMADQWKDQVDEARDAIAEVAPEDFEAQKKQYLMLLESADKNLDTLNSAETSEEFAQLAQQAAIGLMGQAMIAFQSQDGPKGLMPPPTGEGVVILISRELEDEELDKVLASIDETTENITYTASPFAGQTMIQVNPVPDVIAFSQQITFGTVTEVDVEERTIKVDIDPEATTVPETENP